MLTKKEQKHCSELIKKVLTPSIRKKTEQEKYDSKVKRIGCEYSKDYECPICGEELLVTCIHPLELYCTRCRENVELNELKFLHKPEKYLKGGKNEEKIR